MGWPFQSKPQQILEPAAAPVADRVAQAHEKLRAVKADLAKLDAEMLAFRTEHNLVTDRFGRILACYSDSVNGRSRVETEWRSLLQRRDKLVARWGDALKEWSALKTARQEATCLTR